MKFATVSSEDNIDIPLWTSLLAQLKIQLDGKSPDLLLAFLSPHHTHAMQELVAFANDHLHAGCLMAVTAEGVIANHSEIEQKQAVVLTGLHDESLETFSFVMRPDMWSLLLSAPEEFRDYIDAPDDTKLFMLFADPFSTPMDEVLAMFDRAYPGVPVVGGMSSGALRPNGNLLCLNEQVTRSGLIGVGLRGNFSIDIVTSQGCRPIWHEFTVFATRGNRILNIDGYPPLAWIGQLAEELDPKDREALDEGLFVGRAIDPTRAAYGRGDFLIHGVVGVNQHDGSIIVSGNIQAGDTIQFHVRDAESARDDLELALVPQSFKPEAAGALLFTCNGRGTRLYDFPNGDVSIIQEYLNDKPLGGFFCAGEIAPMSGKSYLQGHTACVVIFR